MVILRGTARMPGFPSLSDEELRALVGYMTRGEDSELSHTPASPVDLRDRFTGYTRFLDPDGYPAVAPPWGTLNAINLNTGEYGRSRSENTRARREGASEHGQRELRRTDRHCRWTRLHRRNELRQELRAFDKETGTLLWKPSCPSPATRRRRPTWFAEGSSW